MSKPMNIPVLGLVLLVMVLTGHAIAADGPSEAKITGVSITPDQKQILIRYDGQPGKHSASIIGKPNRLVLDFEAASISTVPWRIKADGGPAREIRLGQVDSKARVVVDFGESAVPTFKMVRGANMFMVSFSKGPAPKAERQTIQPVVQRRAPAAGAEPEAAPTGKGDSPILVKRASASESRVFLEVADHRNPELTSRIELELDSRDMSIRQAAVTDSRGATRRFELVGKTDADQQPNPEWETARVPAGPRKNPRAAVQEPQDKARFKWGMPATDHPSSGYQSTRAAAGTGLRMESFQLPR